VHRSIAGYNPYDLFILTIDYSKNFTTNKVLTIGHMSMFVVKFIVIQNNGLAYGSISCLRAMIVLMVKEMSTLYKICRETIFYIP